MGRKNNSESAEQKRALYEPLDFFVVRAPLLPIEHYFQLSRLCKSDRLDINTLISGNEKIKRALSVGNASFYAVLKKETNIAEGSTPVIKDSGKILGKLLRLLIRMSSRPTPLGLYAGLGLGSWGEKTDFTILETAANSRSRLDMGLLAKLALNLEVDLLKHLQLVANSTLTIHANRLYLLEKAPVLTETDLDGLSIEATDEIRAIISLAKKPISYGDLLESVRESTEMDVEDLESMIEQLVEHTFLLTNLRPNTFDTKATEDLIDVLQKIPQGQPVFQKLKSLLEELRSFDENIGVVGSDRYQALIEMGRKLTLQGNTSETEAERHGNGAGPGAGAGAGAKAGAEDGVEDGVEGDDLVNADPMLHETVQATMVGSLSGANIQTDMALTLGSSQLNKSISSEISKFIDLMANISTSKGQPPLQAYREQFERRYENREVPLLELLNRDTGLGFPDSMEGASGGGQPGASFSERQQVLNEIIFDAIRDGQRSVKFDDKRLKALMKPAMTPEMQSHGGENFPLSCDVFVTVYAKSLADIDEGNFLLSPPSAMPGAGRNLGRFADMLGEPALAALRSVAEREKLHVPHKIHAELSAMPRVFRVGNVCTAPIVRPYLIALDSWTENSTQQIIELSDLLVGVRANRFYLRSVSLRSEILLSAPHLANAAFNTAIARFLKQVSEDGVSYILGFDWGIATNSNFTPRLTRGKFILCKARWTIRPGTERGQFDSAEKFRTWLHAWRTRWFVPRYVEIVELDNRLLIDLEDEYQVTELRRELQNSKKESIQLQEAFCDPSNLWATGSDGHYATELVVPFILSASQNRIQVENEERIGDRLGTDSHFDPGSISSEFREKLPGSDWLFAKFYCPKNFADELIARDFLELASSSIQDKVADSWYFIRYADPDDHLRLRFSGNPAFLRDKMMKSILDLAHTLKGRGWRSKVVIDTYDREIERYGGVEAIALAEKLFSIDSDAVSRILKLECDDEEWAHERMNICVYSIDRMLGALGLQGKERKDWYRSYAPARSEVGPEFRTRKSTLLPIFADAANVLPKELNDILADWNAKIKPIAEQLHLMESQQKLTHSCNFIFSSFVHMHCNRMGLTVSEETRARALACRVNDAKQSVEETIAVAHS